MLRRSLALALVAMSLAGCSLQTDLRDRLINPVRAGKAAPAFLIGSVEGTAVSLGDFGGAPVVLNFWGAWCPPCRNEQPALQRVSQEFEASGVRFLGVDVGDPLGRARDFQREYRVTYPSAYDPRGQVAHTYHVDVFPTTFLIDDKGIIVHRRQRCCLRRGPPEPDPHEAAEAEARVAELPPPEGARSPRNWTGDSPLSYHSRVVCRSLVPEKRTALA